MGPSTSAPASTTPVAIVEVSGAATSSPFDVSAFNSEAQVASDQPSSGAATTSANDIVLGYVEGDYDFGFSTGSGFTLDTTSNATNDIIEHKSQSSAGSISATATSSDAWRGWSDLMVAFKPGSTTTTTTALQYYHPDHLSPRVTTDSSGNVIGQQGHYPFGESWYAPGTTTKYQFTSYERDSESGNDYAQARYHINRLGRFASPDPLSGDIGDPQSLNRYAYARNDAIDLDDPTGLAWIWQCYSASSAGPDGNIGSSGCEFVWDPDKTDQGGSTGPSSAGGGGQGAAVGGANGSDGAGGGVAARLSCAANFADNHSLASALHVQNSFLGKAFLGNTVSGLTQLGLFVFSKPNDVTPKDVGVALLSGTSQGLPVGKTRIAKGPIGVVQDAIVGPVAAAAANSWTVASSQTLELGISASRVGAAAAGVGAETAASVVALVKFGADLAIFGYGALTNVGTDGTFPGSVGTDGTFPDTFSGKWRG